ncbi:MAG TPA: polysaccharide biosynthesis C-terminal domain-containing protein [Streptosporangiaceae bacterium]
MRGRSEAAGSGPGAPPGEASAHAGPGARGRPGTAGATGQRGAGPGGPARQPQAGQAGRSGPGRAGPGKAGAGQDQSGKPQLAEVARGGTLNIAGAAVSAVATLAVSVMVTNRFNKTIAGAFFTATSAYLIVQALATLGANVGLVYFIARLRSLGEERRIRAIVRAAVIPVIVGSVLLTIGMLAFAGPLAHVLLAKDSGSKGGAAASPGAVAGALRLLSLTLLFAALENTFLGATRGYRDMRPTVMVEKIGRPLLQVACMAVAVVAGSAALLAPLWALPWIPASAISYVWLRRVRRRRGPRRATMPDLPPEVAALLALSTPVPSPAWGRSPDSGRPVRRPEDTRSGRRMARRQLANANPKGFWRFTTPRAIANLASIILQRMDIVLVALIKGPIAAAVYTAATRFLVAGQLGNMAISTAAQPRFTELFTTGDKRNANVIYLVTTGWLILLTWPLYLLAVIYGPAVLAVFGKSYSAGATVMIILGLTQLFASACGQVDMVLITTGRSSWSLVNGLLAVGVNIGVDLALIPRYGITGAAIGWAVAIVVSNLMPLIQLALVFRLHPIGRGTFTACALCAVCFGAIPGLIRIAIGAGFVSLGASIVAGGIVYLAGLWKFGDVLKLSTMPGVSSLARRARRVRASSDLSGY